MHTELAQNNVCVPPLISQKEISKDSSFSLSYDDSFLSKQTITTTILYYILLLLLCTLVPRYCILVPWYQRACFSLGSEIE
jgi:hypothetical protein